MLDVTTNQNINCTSNGLLNSLDDDMDPLFDNDWLHEHNLDILFDLFEEEIEGGKGLDGATATGSSTIFGTSPVTSYSFGTSPSLVSALDLYDLIYFDGQQQQQQQTSSGTTPPQQTTTTNPATNVNLIPNTNNHNRNKTTTTDTTFIINGPQATGSSSSGVSSISSATNQTQISQNVSTNQIADSILNAMKIKRKLKKGQSAGVSLLARPRGDNTSGSSSSNNNSTSSSCCNNISTIGGSVNKSKSDKTSIEITNLKAKPSSNNSYSRAIDINHSKQSHINVNHNHYRYRAGFAVIQEHAYAVRGH